MECECKDVTCKICATSAGSKCPYEAKVVARINNKRYALCNTCFAYTSFRYKNVEVLHDRRFK